MKAIIKLEIECEIESVMGDEEHVWAKPVNAQRRYMIHKDRLPDDAIERFEWLQKNRRSV